MLNKCDQQFTISNENLTINDHLIKASNVFKNTIKNIDDVEHLRLKIYEQIDRSKRTCEDFAIITISALENLNVYKSALWIINLILEKMHK